ncbi:MAG TPA: nicotinate phosphoribosyltransferase [Gammaproteobacteria bacterium]|nr:nicotinate phosphoribosyltransferase [Gammaproteobacteria bacterium]
MSHSGAPDSNPTNERRWINVADLGLFTDLYELTMLQGYWASGMTGSATFSLYFRKMPASRQFMLACGQQHAAHLATRLRFTKADLDQLATLGQFRDDFLRWLEDFRFTGDVVAMPEGTPVFPQEPLLEVTAPVAEAQLLETLLMNLVHLETVLASKAARIVLAAAGKPVADFGMRRMHGMDAAVQGARAYRTAGIAGTSNVLAGLHFDLPVQGTMAHSFIQTFGDETAAFKTYMELYPGTTLLIDTYDTAGAVEKIIALKREMGERFNIGAIRLDSGDLNALARTAREKLDAAGLDDVRIVASGGLDEYIIAKLTRAGAPIDAFGVGTSLGTSADAPNLDLAYKLTLYDGEPRLKNSPGKEVYPGQKQVFRHYGADGAVKRDEVTLRDEQRDATPLLTPIVANGERLAAETLDIKAAAAYAKREIERLPPRLLAIDSGDEPFDVEISPAVRELREQALAKLQKS